MGANLGLGGGLVPCGFNCPWMLSAPTASNKPSYWSSHSRGAVPAHPDGAVASTVSWCGSFLQSAGRERLFTLPSVPTAADAGKLSLNTFCCGRGLFFFPFWAGSCPDLVWRCLWCNCGNIWGCELFSWAPLICRLCSEAHTGFTTNFCSTDAHSSCLGVFYVDMGVMRPTKIASSDFNHHQITAMPEANYNSFLTMSPCYLCDRDGDNEN